MNEGCPAFLLCSPLYAASDFCGHHFYTISEAEANQGNGWEVEGITGFTGSTNKGMPDAVPLHRLWNGQLSDHLYTTSAAEVQSAQGVGYVYEGTMGCIFPTQKPSSTPLYRLRDGKRNDHFYTTSWTETKNATKIGYSYEGIAGYVLLPKEIPATQPQAKGMFISGRVLAIMWNSNLQPIYRTWNKNCGSWTEDALKIGVELLKVCVENQCWLMFTGGSDAGPARK